MARPRFALVLTLFALIPCAASAAPAGGAWQKIPFRRWSDCYVAQSAGLKVIVAPAVGGRILWFGTPEKNLLFEDPGADGKLFPEGALWMPWDGCQTDLVDDNDGRQHGPVWLGRYDILSLGRSALVLRSVVHPKNGIQVTKRYELDARIPGLRYTVTATNRSAQAAGWAIWERALFATPGQAMLPRRDDGPLKGLWTKDVPEGAVKVDGPIAEIRPQGKGATVATDSLEGWVSYHAGPYGVRIGYDRRPGTGYREGKSCIVFFADNRVELEPLSPRVELKPGESVTLAETWKLLK